jgi:tRNA G18 (ribose-2'-O)-methylase SpoU
MGAVFNLAWATVADTATALAAARSVGMSTIALDPGASTSIRQWRREGPTMLLVGTEGPGLSESAKAGTDVTLSIPMAHGTDSLNVAMAATVACYALTS